MRLLVLLILVERSHAGSWATYTETLTASSYDMKDSEWGGSDTKSIAMSDDGSTILAGAWSSKGGPELWISTDTGVTWTAPSSMDSITNFRQVCVSSDGTVLATISSDDVYISTDSGSSWTTYDSILASMENEYGASGAFACRSSSSSGNMCYFQALAMSADGSTLMAVVYKANPWLSTDSGASWSEITTIGTTGSVTDFYTDGTMWTAADMSEDGTTLFVAGQGTDIWRSQDSGATYAPRVFPPFLPPVECEFGHRQDSSQ